MGRKPSERVRVSKTCIKDALKDRGYTQIKLAEKLNRDKDNINKQIRTESMDIDLLTEISQTIRVPKAYLKGELLVTDSKELFIPTTHRDSRGFLIPSLEEEMMRAETQIDSVDNFFLNIGNTLLDMHAFLVKERLIDSTPFTLKYLHLSECDYLFDRLGIMKKLPLILREIEENRKESKHGEEN